MKWLLGIVLVLFLGTVATSLVVGIATDDTVSVSIPAPRPTTSTTPTTSTSGGPTTSTQPTTTTTPGERTYTLAEIARHASSTDCWLLVSGAVYDVTSYLSRHPGGAGLITPWCGKEATVAFATEDGRGEHSSRAYSLLGTYYIGDRQG